MLWFSRTRQQKKISHRLASTELFCNLTQRELKIVDAFLHDRQFLAGEVVFDAGEEGQALYIIVKSYDALNMPQMRDDALRVLENNYPQTPYLTQGFKSKTQPWWKLW